MAFMAYFLSPGGKPRKVPVVSGYNGLLRPNVPVGRGEVAKMLLIIW